MRSDATWHRWCESPCAGVNKCPSSGRQPIFTGAAFSALALDFGITPEWKKRKAWLLLVGRRESQACPIFRAVENIDTSHFAYFQYTPYQKDKAEHTACTHYKLQDTFGMVQYVRSPSNQCRNIQGQRRTHFSPSLVIPTGLFSSRLMRPALSIAVVNTVFLMVGKPWASKSLGRASPAFTLRAASTNFSIEMYP